MCSSDLTPTTMYVHIHLPRFVSLGLRRLTIYLAITTTPPPHHHNVCASFQSLLLIHFNLRTKAGRSGGISYRKRGEVIGSVGNMGRVVGVVAAAPNELLVVRRLK